jgi:2-polyprenyl-3-methyl-5-hydroxy-6-metoxy-1,4-benzoquinol methylase
MGYGLRFKNKCYKFVFEQRCNPCQIFKHYFDQITCFLVNIFKFQKFSFDLNSKQYWDLELSKYETFWRNENYFHILDLLPDRQEISILDIGCAIGDGCELLQERFPEAKITGVDISKVGIEKAKKKSKKINYFNLDILKEPVLEFYHYILLIQTLEHFSDPFSILNKCLKQVKKAVIISVPYRAEYTGKNRRVGFHRYYFNEETFLNYNVRVVKVTDFVKVTESKCIIYEISPFY